MELLHRLKFAFYVRPVTVFDSGVIVCRQQLRRSYYSRLCNLRRQRQCPPYDSRHIHQSNDDYSLTAIVVLIIQRRVFPNSCRCFHHINVMDFVNIVIVGINFNVGVYGPPSLSLFMSTSGGIYDRRCIGLMSTSGF